MIARTAVLFVLTSLLAAGGFAVAARVDVAQAPSGTAEQTPAVTAPAPATPAPPAAMPESAPAAAAPAPPASPAAGQACAGRRQAAGQAAIRARAAAFARQGHGDRLLPTRLPARRRRTSEGWPELAGDAVVAQPQLGSSRAGQVSGEIRAARRQGDRLERRHGWRYGAAARRPLALRPHEPSDWPRRRYLVHADARPQAERG